MELLSRINDLITVDYIKERLSETEGNSKAVDHSKEHDREDEKGAPRQTNGGSGSTEINQQDPSGEGVSAIEVENKGKLLVDATVAPQDITFPTDLKLLNAARKKSEQLIDKLYCGELHGAPKPRTYRKVARKHYLNTAKKKGKRQKSCIRQMAGSCGIYEGI